MRRMLALAFLSGLVLSCGGGSVGGGGGSSVKINSVSISPQTLNPGTNFTVNWSVSYSSMSGSYSAEGYLNATQSVPSLSNYQLFHKNCGGSIYSCGSSGSVTCTYTKRDQITNEAVFDCGGIGTARVDLSGPAYFIFRACIYDENMNYVCDKKVIQVTVN